jgi:hypothetical protein
LYGVGPDPVIGIEQQVFEFRDDILVQTPELLVFAP